MNERKRKKNTIKKSVCMIDEEAESFVFNLLLDEKECGIYNNYHINQPL